MNGNQGHRVYVDSPFKRRSTADGSTRRRAPRAASREKISRLSQPSSVRDVPRRPPSSSLRIEQIVRLRKQLPSSVRFGQRGRSEAALPDVVAAITAPRSTTSPPHPAVSSFADATFHYGGNEDAERWRAAAEAGGSLGRSVSAAPRRGPRSSQGLRMARPETTASVGVLPEGGFLEMPAIAVDGSPMPGAAPPSRSAFPGDRSRASPPDTGGSAHALRSQCEYLAARLQALEAAVGAAGPGSPLHGGTQAREGWGGHTTELNWEEEEEEDEEVEAERSLADKRRRETVAPDLEHRFSEIHGILHQLDSVYNERQAAKEEKERAATLLAAAARGFLTRRTRAHHDAALQRWRARRAASFLRAAEAFRRRQRNVQRSVAVWADRQGSELKSRVFHSWRGLARQQRPFRVERARQAAGFARRRARRRVLRMVQAWRALVRGPTSRRAMRALQRARRDLVTAQLKHAREEAARAAEPGRQGRAATGEGQHARWALLAVHMAGALWREAGIRVAAQRNPATGDASTVVDCVQRLGATSVNRALPPPPPPWPHREGEWDGSAMGDAAAVDAEDVEAWVAAHTRGAPHCVAEAVEALTRLPPELVADGSQPGPVEERAIHARVRAMHEALLQMSAYQSSLARHWRAWHAALVAPLRQNYAFARASHAAVLTRRVLAAWRRWYQERQGEGLDRKRLAGRMHFPQRHNLRKVERHYRRNLLGKVMRRWHRHAHVHRTAWRRFVALQTALSRTVVHAWREQAQWQRRVRELVVNEWREYSYRLFNLPFRAWFVYTQEHKAKRRLQERVIQAFHRRTNIRLSQRCFKRWRQLSTFGQSAVVRSREDLLKALGEQKEAVQQLQRVNDEYQRGTAELKRSVERLEASLAARQREVLERERQVTTGDLARVAAEEYIVRLQSALDAAAVMHPGTLRRLLARAEAEGERYRARRAAAIDAMGASHPQAAPSARGGGGEVPESAPHGPAPTRPPSAVAGGEGAAAAGPAAEGGGDSAAAPAEPAPAGQRSDFALDRGLDLGTGVAALARKRDAQARSERENQVQISTRDAWLLVRVKQVLFAWRQRQARAKAAGSAAPEGLLPGQGPPAAEDHATAQVGEEADLDGGPGAGEATVVGQLASVLDDVSALEPPAGVAAPYSHRGGGGDADLRSSLSDRMLAFLDSGRLTEFGDEAGAKAVELAQARGIQDPTRAFGDSVGVISGLVGGAVHSAVASVHEARAAQGTEPEAEEGAGEPEEAKTTVAGAVARATDDAVLQREAQRYSLEGQGRSWQDFVLQVNKAFPLRHKTTETARERLERRLAELTEEEAAQGEGRPARLNAYQLRR